MQLSYNFVLIRDVQKPADPELWRGVVVEANGPGDIRPGSTVVFHRSAVDYQVTIDGVPHNLIRAHSIFLIL